MSSALPSDPSTRLSSALAPGHRHLRRAALLSVLAGLVWPVQAALVAWVLGEVLTGASPTPMAAALGFGGLDLLRIALTFIAEAQSQAGAELIIAQARAHIVATEARRAGDSAFAGREAWRLWRGKSWTFWPPLSRAMPRRGRG